MNELAGDRVAIIGSGGIGGMLAAELVGAGRAVTLCVRTPFDRLTVESGGRTREFAVDMASSPDEVANSRWVLVTTKAQDTAGAAPWLAKLSGTGTTVVVVQNGVHQAERVRPYTSATDIVPATIYCSVERTAPGHIVHHGSAKIVIPKGPTSPALAALFAGTMFEIVEEEDFITASWTKLLNNLVANPLTALTLRRSGALAEGPIQDLARGLLTEAVAVARADGAKLGEADVEHSVRRLAALNPQGGTSMLYDRLAGRPLEHEYITGAVVQGARRHGIAAPLNGALLALLATVSGRPLDGSS